MNFRTISQLPPFTPSPDNVLGDSSLMEISREIPRNANIQDDPVRYQSYSIQVGVLEDIIKNKVLDTLSGNSEFGDEHYLMWRWLQKIVANNPTSSDFTISGDHLHFLHVPMISGEINNFNFKPDERAVNVDTMRNFMVMNSPLFIGEESRFSTSYFNVENNLTLSSDEALMVNGEKHNSYLFQIIRSTSNVWTTTDSGIFTCFGWVDEEVEGNIDNSQRWIALEGKLGTAGDDTDWKILQLQPFIHNLFCSYVSFTFPVSKGLDLRIRTGFRVGSNSNKYQSTQGSLTNHIANAFIGGIYKNKDFYNDGSTTGGGFSNTITDINNLGKDAALQDVIDKVNEVINSLKYE